MGFRRPMFVGLLVVWAVVSIVGQAIAQPVRFVRADAEGAETGLTWVDAWSDLQEALNTATGDVQIWVAAGVYEPGSVRADSFQLADGVELYGGFAGSEDPATFALRDRNPLIHETILSGDFIGGRAFHVVTASGVGASAVLDGFTIRGGRADGVSSSLKDVGGGMLITQANPTIRNCVFIDNQAANGGAVYNTGGMPMFVGCRFLNNQAFACQVGGSGALGGGVYTFGGARPSLVNCLFVANRAGCGVGGSGGAVFGGATLINCTFSLNRADTSGGALAGGNQTVSNCVLWGNRTGRGSGTVEQIAGSAAVMFSLVQGGHLGEGNIDADPMFVSLQGVDAMAGTTDDDLSLSSGSSGIDAGSNALYATNVTEDLVGLFRMINDSATPDTGRPLGAPAIIDMGAYEFQQPCQIDGDCGPSNACRTSHCDLATNQCVHEFVDCDDANACTDDICDAVSGCLHLSNGVACDDGDVCSTNDTCAGGACSPGAALDCDDMDPCTDDVCVSPNGCQYSFNSAACDDTDACTTGDACFAGVCVGGAPPNCDDLDACTTDACDSLAGCVNTDASAACDDGVFCNGAELCDSALGCLPGMAPSCDDGVACTVDTCDVDVDKCEHLPDNSICDDGLLCNGAEACDLANGCVAGAPFDCDDDIACTVDSCNEATAGCDHESDDSLCDNGVFCDGVEVCDVLTGCVRGDPPSCDDGVPCTDDACDLQDDLCTHGPDDSACDNDTFCDGVEICDAIAGCQSIDVPCVGRVCVEASRDCVDCIGDGDCADGDACTIDRCSIGLCSHEAIAGCGGTGSGPVDGCPGDPAKTSPGVCGCGVPDVDSDGDGVFDCVDGCPTDSLKTELGVCGCNAPDADADGDGVPDCADQCPDDSDKTSAGVCGCGVIDADTDGDGTFDCEDQCPGDPLKTTPGLCGCNLAETDSDGDAVVDCVDACLGTAVGLPVDASGCAIDPPAAQVLSDEDGDGVADDHDVCPETALGVGVGADGCAVFSSDGSTDLLPGPSVCGSCGSVGLVGWTMLSLSLFGLRLGRERRSARHALATVARARRQRSQSV